MLYNLHRRESKKYVAVENHINQLRPCFLKYFVVQYLINYHLQGIFHSSVQPFVVHFFVLTSAQYSYIKSYRKCVASVTFHCGNGGEYEGVGFKGKDWRALALLPLRWLQLPKVYRKTVLRARRKLKLRSDVINIAHL